MSKKKSTPAPSKIYKIGFGKYKPEWFALDKSAQDAMWEKINKEMKRLGGKMILYCNSRWASEEWQGFLVEEWPNVEALQEFASIMEETGWYAYIDSRTMIGVGGPPA